MKLSELLSQIDDFKDAASLVGDDDPRLFFLVDRDDKRQVLVTNIYLAFDHSERKVRRVAFGIRLFWD
jgi:hypothetical protein